MKVRSSIQEYAEINHFRGNFQAAIVSRKKEAAAEQMEQLQAELSQVLSELEDKRQKSAAYADTHAVLRGEEFKQYVTKLR